MVDKEQVNYRNLIDDDEGLQSKKKILSILSILLIAINFTGAKFQEANTFIFKIEFTNQDGLSHLLLLSVVFSLIRYFSHAHVYHEELRALWCARLLKDKLKVLYGPDYSCSDCRGFLAPAIDVCIDDEPGVKDSSYVITGLFQREIQYPSVYRDEDGRNETTDVIKLTKFNDKWKRKDFFKLLLIENKYQFSGIIKYRENLDLLGPYVLGVSALLLTLFSLLSPDSLA